MEQSSTDVPIILRAEILLTQTLKNAPTTVIIREVIVEEGGID